MKRSFLICLLLFLRFAAFAQDDLLQMIADSTDGRAPVIGTFKSTKLINLQTNETIRKKTLDVRISHLFGPVGRKSGGSVHSLYGLDQSDDIRIGLHYGISNRVMVGVSRSKRFENLEGLVKVKVLEQRKDNDIPASVTFFGNVTWSARNSALFAEQTDRMSYCYQLILARKFNSRFSMMLVPTFLHRNLVYEPDENNTFSMSAGARFKFSPSTSFIADYSHTFNAESPVQKNEDVIGAGFEIETGGHVFTLMFSNASGLLENDYLVNTKDTWKAGGMKLSFIISRIFKMEKKKKVSSDQ